MINNTCRAPFLFTILSSFIVIGGIVAIAYYLSVKRPKYDGFTKERITVRNSVPLTFASLILGLGIGGFIDGILFHQILQWHNMLSGKLSPDTVDAKSVNMFWDGIFHAFTLLVVIIGLVAFWKASRHTYAKKSGNLFAGGMLCGWAIFNLIEGVINHHILRLHNVRDKAEHTDYYNYSFLMVSIVLLVAGILILSKYYKFSKTKKI